MKRGVFVFPTINLQVQVQVIWVLSITSAWWTKSLQKREIFNGHRQLLLVDGWNPPDHLGYVLYICIYIMYIYIYNLVSNGIIYLSNWCRTSSINSYQYTRVAPSTFKWFSTYVPSDIWLAWDLCFLELVRLTKKTAKKTGLLTSRVHRKTISKSKKRYVYSINNMYIYIYTHHIITYFIYIYIHHIFTYFIYIYIYHIPFLKLTVSHLKIDAWNSIPSFWGAVLLAGATVKRTWTTWISTPKLRPNWASNCINQYQHANHEIKSDGSCKIFFDKFRKSK